MVTRGEAIALDKGHLPNVWSATLGEEPEVELALLWRIHARVPLTERPAVACNTLDGVASP